MLDPAELELHTASLATMVVWEQNRGPLDEHPVPLSIEPSHQFDPQGFKDIFIRFVSWALDTKPIINLLA